jgi:hypothetical protein
MTGNAKTIEILVSFWKTFEKPNRRSCMIPAENSPTKQYTRIHRNSDVHMRDEVGNGFSGNRIRDGPDNRLIPDEAALGDVEAR